MIFACRSFVICGRFSALHILVTIYLARCLTCVNFGLNLYGLSMILMVILGGFLLRFDETGF